MGITGHPAPVGSSCGCGCCGGAGSEEAGALVVEGAEVVSSGVASSNKAMAASSADGEGGGSGTPRPDLSKPVPASTSCLGTVGSRPAETLQVGHV